MKQGTLTRRLWRLAQLATAGMLALLLLAFSPLTAGSVVDAAPLAQPLAQTNDLTPTVTQGGIFTNTWVIQVAPGADVNAIAARAGMEVVMPVGSLPGYYILRAANVSGRAQNVTQTLRADAGVLYARQQMTLARATRVETRDPADDPEYADQWHLDNTGQGGGTVGADVNILDAWAAGYTGEGVVVASVDDGVWVEHPDLAPNMRLDLSYDFINDDPDPSAGGHGTSVAGVMAAADNGTPVIDDYCGVGAAYDAGIAGLYMLDFGLTDAIEGASLSYMSNDIHIYNNSWGPFDDGYTLEGPGPLAAAALESGAATGRNGLGTIYAWAAGNGGTTDNINADGYANSIYVIAVGASTNQGTRSWYSEPGAAMLINAPSSGGTLGISTTGYGDTGCTNGFGGTSSAAPLAAGVMALVLDANPNLTYRDMMHILVNTSDVIDAANPDWQTNGAGRQFSHYYGFGRINAKSAVDAALTWQTVDAHTSFTSDVETVNAVIPEDANNPVTDTITVTENLKLEHVQIVFNADHNVRGQIHVDLVSPDGTVSKMMFGRPDNGDDYANWTMTSVAHWDELSAGDWTIRVWDRTNDSNDGTFNSWQLILWGTEQLDGTITPTPSATSDVTATPTPTATPTDIPANELLDNGGFEAQDGTGAPDLLPWTVVNGTGEKIKCNKPDKIIANTGECAFRFKGSVDENSKLRQTVDLTGVVLTADDALTLSAAVKSSSTGTVKIKLRVKYTDGTAKGKRNLDIVPTDDYMVLNDTLELDSPAIASIRVSIDSKATAGKVWVDDVSLLYAPSTVITPSATPTIDLSATATPTIDLSATATPTLDSSATATPSETPTLGAPRGEVIPLP
jgi:subtilisin family serine protease